MDMTLEKEIEEILQGSPPVRIQSVTNILKKEGLSTSEELKYYDWKSLEEIGGLSEMEIKKIMRFVQKNFPNEYTDHKTKRDRYVSMKYEKDILNLNLKMQEECLLLERKRIEEQQKIKRELEEMRKRHEEKFKNESSSSVFNKIRLGANQNYYLKKVNGFISCMSRKGNKKVHEASAPENQDKVHQKKEVSNDDDYDIISNKELQSI